MRTLRYHLKVYKSYLDIAYAQALSFRLNFTLYLILDLFFYSSSLGTAYIIFNHTETIGPWNREQFMFFLSFMLLVDHFDLTYMTGSFWKFSEQLRTGTFDFLLLKPTNGIFTTFCSNIRAATIFNGVFPLGLVIYFGSKANLPIESWFILPFVFCLSLALLFAIEIMICLTMFWSIESWGINILRIQCKQIGCWPDFIYALTFRRVFTFGFPLLMIGSFPVKVLFDTSVWPILLEMCLLLVISIVAIRFLWTKGLLQYESASS